jgi:hypothetical protein
MKRRVILSRLNGKVNSPSPVQQAEQDYQITALNMRRGTPRIEAKINGFKRIYRGFRSRRLNH